MRTVARHASAWIVTDSPTDEEATEQEVYAELSGQLAKLDAACEATDRDPATLDRLLLNGFSAIRPLSSVEAFADFEGRCAELGFTDLVVHHPRATEPFAASMDVLERIAPAHR